MRLEDFLYGINPAISVFSDDPTRIRHLRNAIEQAGGQVGRSASLADFAALGDLGKREAALVHVDTHLGFATDDIFTKADRLSMPDRCGCALLISQPLLDAAFASVSEPNIILCEPDELDLDRAIGALLTRSPVGLHDATKEGFDALRLRELSNEVERIARRLSALSGTEGSVASGAAIGLTTFDASDIRAMIRARRLRDSYLGADLFADPAWDMMLDLAAARLEGRKVAVSSLCIAAAVPATTALRWISALTDAGLFVRTADPKDRRRVYIELSNEAAQRIMSYLVAAQSLVPIV